MGKWAFGFIILIILVLSLTFVSNNASGVTATVVVRFDFENMEYTLGRNDSNTLIGSGHIIFEVEDLIEDYQYIKVYLYTANNDGWSSNVSPSVIRFHESGIERFNASILIPHNAYNGTEVMLVIFGSWVVEPQGEQLPGSSGSVIGDTINITIIRPEPPSIQEIYNEGSEGSNPGFNWLGFPNVLVTVVLPIFCVILISYFAVKRRKRKKK